MSDDMLGKGWQGSYARFEPNPIRRQGMMGERYYSGTWGVPFTSLP